LIPATNDTCYQRDSSRPRVIFGFTFPLGFVQTDMIAVCLMLAQGASPVWQISS
jgi:hypothetical protein